MSTQMPLYHTYCTISLIPVSTNTPPILHPLVVLLLQGGGPAGLLRIPGSGQGQYRGLVLSWNACYPVSTPTPTNYTLYMDTYPYQSRGIHPRGDGVLPPVRVGIHRVQVCIVVGIGSIDVLTPLLLTSKYYLQPLFPWRIPTPLYRGQCTEGMDSINQQ